MPRSSPIAHATCFSFVTGGDDAGFAPSFVEKPRIIPNETGTIITMKCKCKAKPQPVVTWYRGTTIVKESSKIKIRSLDKEDDSYELTLEIQDPAGSDGGTYRCHVKNEFGESNANLNLNIEAEPEPEGDGPTFVQKPRIISERGGKLDPGTEDSGLYKCNIKNTMGELNANLTLNIEIIPVIKEKPKVTKIIKKKTIIVECKVESKFAPQCTWFKEKSAVREDSRHFVRIEQVREGEFAVKLEIESCMVSDKGVYKLVAKNEKGEATSQTVEVIDIPTEEEEPKKGKKPTFAKGLQSLKKEEKVEEKKKEEKIVEQEKKTELEKKPEPEKDAMESDEYEEEESEEEWDSQEKNVPEKKPDTKKTEVEKVNEVSKTVEEKKSSKLKVREKILLF
uniref:(California timema) hypothetical protein n=1 Tax=Timema californicum TaxID=61474 RepID=A0A7R9IVG8_TIMCA|nr:unnamed protein product [Timema californicum]